MSKRIVAIGRTEDGTTTIYAPVQKPVGLYAAHAVRLWSELGVLVEMVEAANVPGTAARIASAKEACENFRMFWIGE